jgi:EAL domain-containing protein (putative c-di-GMP-specific phosphodiesterase class I)
MGGYAMDDADELLRNAEVATARAQADGGGRWASFDPSMHEAALARFELEQSLAGALEGGQLTLDYQPMVRLAGPYAGSGHIRHAEALIRWRHPDRGLVGPDEFVPLAEESGLIVPIGTWVLREATRQARVWQLMSDDTSRFTVSVNLSPRQLHHPGLVGDVALALRASGLAAGTLVLEITEGAVLRDPEAAIPVLAALRQLGVRIALDDFGTGQSSLSHLTRLPLDSLKVDRSFVAGLGSDGPETAVVRALIQLGKVLGLEVIAEGVETREQLASLRSMGCDLAQGFFFGKPLGPDGITALLRAERRKSGSWAAVR